MNWGKVFNYDGGNKSLDETKKPNKIFVNMKLYVKMNYNVEKIFKMLFEHY